QFLSIQKIGATGLLKGKGEPFQWANRTWFYPDSAVNASMLINDLSDFTGYKMPAITDAPLSVPQAIKLVGSLNRSEGNIVEVSSAVWSSWGLKGYDESRPITRAELAVLLDRTIRPFESRDVDHSGNFKSTNKN
ncbi:MAG: hypothetical protein RJA57_765, partial [Bacteroidota bacterium]